MDANSVLGDELLQLALRAEPSSDGLVEVVVEAYLTTNENCVPYYLGLTAYKDVLKI